MDSAAGTEISEITGTTIKGPGFGRVFRDAVPAIVHPGETVAGVEISVGALFLA